VEIRARLPSGKGIWPAHWTLRPDSDLFAGGSWPPEIDITEAIGTAINQQVMTTFWCPSDGVGCWTAPLTSSTTYTLPSGTLASDYHRFELEWEKPVGSTPAQLRWYVDRDLTNNVNTTARKVFSAGGTNVVTGQALELILNTAVGGNWPGAPDASTVFPQTHAIDYVRVYHAACAPGYQGDGYACTDINECASGNGGCSPFATCTNTDGSRTCTCNAGYSGDGVTCTPSCSHGVCVQGAALSQTCGSCASTVCAADSYCCTTYWDGICVSEATSMCLLCGAPSPSPSPSLPPSPPPACAHAVCAQGSPLSRGCGACAAKVCGGDPFCCATYWDGICVNEASQWCACGP
jgi:hypothetical protein